jgi:protein-disulfide isomerase
VLAVLTAVSIAVWAQVGLAQTSSEMESLKKEIDGLKQGLGAIQKDLQEIKGLLRARPTAAAAPPAPPAEAMVTIDGSPFKGKKDARVTIVDFTDYQ